MNSKGIQTLREASDYWADCIKLLGSKPDSVVAGYMANIVSNEHWEEWYNESKGDPYFVEIFDLVADLETPIERELSRDEAWERVKKLVAEMSHKYN